MLFWPRQTSRGPELYPADDRSRPRSRPADRALARVKSACAATPACRDLRDPLHETDDLGAPDREDSLSAEPVRSLAFRLALGAPLAWAALQASPALAQQSGPASIRSPADLTQHPDRYVGRSVVWVKGYCFFDDPTYVCVGKDTPFEVLAARIGPAAAKAAVEADCGGMDGAERNPSDECAYSFQFTATSFKAITSDYVLHNQLQQNKRVI